VAGTRGGLLWSPSLLTSPRWRLTPSLDRMTRLWTKAVPSTRQPRSGCCSRSWPATSPRGVAHRPRHAVKVGGSTAEVCPAVRLHCGHYQGVVAEKSRLPAEHRSSRDERNWDGQDLPFLAIYRHHGGKVGFFGTGASWYDSGNYPIPFLRPRRGIGRRAKRRPVTLTLGPGLRDRHPSRHVAMIPHLP
jgi:hypothetical protein